MLVNIWICQFKQLLLFWRSVHTNQSWRYETSVFSFLQQRLAEQLLVQVSKLTVI